ncbi:MAG: methyltransferase protein [Gemmatimonadetes bacterium]|nr:methyltransferase protein [Gemmatimonadota bacterium]
MARTALKTLVMVPTYNERDNAPRMVEAIMALGLDADVLFIDDNSPDGTGALLDELSARHPRLSVRHRSGKNGIGSAHLDGIAAAYEGGYQRLVTLDCDFSHSPEDIPDFLRESETADVVVGSRWTTMHSLPGWNFYRRMMTGMGHVLTRMVLGIPYDATGAFRAYRLDRIPAETFSLVQSRSYSFFFESLFILHKNAFHIREIPIVLPARTYGHSKMTLDAALQSVRIMLGVSRTYRTTPALFHLRIPPAAVRPELHDPQNWGPYWQRSQVMSRRTYAVIASLYRRLFIRPRLHRVLRSQFARGARLLHAGCGGGQVDQGLHEHMRVTALDISADAIRLYHANNPSVSRIEHGDILALPHDDATFDGYYSLGVVEHFTDGQIARILSEARRVLRPGGKVVLFWPHARATSVFVLGIVHTLLARSGSTTELHPAEISLLTSRAMAERIFHDGGFTLTSYDFGAKDLWIQAVVVAERS